MHIHKRSRGLNGSIVNISYLSFFFFWLGSTVVFAVLYTILSTVPGQGPAPIVGTWFERFWQALYFSVITATSTGFGDIVPHGISRGLAALQSLTAVLALAVFVSKMTSRRQDIIMGHVYSLSFGVAFNDIRRGLFIVRKDIDILLKKIRGGESLSGKDWMNLHIALRQMQIFVRSIPNFYDAHKHTEIVLDGQESLLFDSVERTLDRVVEAVEVFKMGNYSIHNNNEDCAHELHNLVALIDSVFPPHERYAIDPSNIGLLNEIVARNQEIRELIKP